LRAGFAVNDSFASSSDILCTQEAISFSGQINERFVKSGPEYIEIEDSGFFQASWYLQRYPDVAVAKKDPLEHYLAYGVKEGRDPGPDFSTSGYLARNRDVAESGINPLLHYIRYGKNEGRPTTACMEPSSIKRCYNDFGQFLTSSLLNPLIQAPFTALDLDNFKFMDQVARRLCHKTTTCANKPLVSVIMPMRDRAGVVKDAVRSVLEQSYEHFELIVVDDGSKDDSVKLVKSFADPRIRLIECGQNRGVSHARNLALAAAKGTLIAYLDSDNTWLCDYLCAMIGFFQVKPDADGAYSGQYVYKGFEDEPFAVRFGCYNPSLLRNRNYIDLNCFVHRANVLKAAGGGFCQTLKRWVDWELILRIARVAKIYSVPILQSNYFLDKAANTITAVQALAPAQDFITATLGYGCKAAPIEHAQKLFRKVAIIVSGHDGLEQLEKCIQSLADYENDPLVKVLAVGAFFDPMGKNENLKFAGTKRVYASPGFDLSDAVQLAMRAADSDSDLLLLDPLATLMPGTLCALQSAAYAKKTVAIAVPQQVRAACSENNTHVPYAFDHLPCDVTLSDHHKNVEPVGLFHDGSVDLNFAPFTCVYIKHEVFKMYNRSRAGSEKKCQYDAIDRHMCDFVRQVLGMRIAYDCSAVVMHARRAD
jgi:O-antigen biosynthesis protein